VSWSFVKNGHVGAPIENRQIYVWDAEVLGSNPGSPTRNMQVSGGYGPR
jgi:hypothetical protein